MISLTNGVYPNENPSKKIQHMKFFLTLRYNFLKTLRYKLDHSIPDRRQDQMLNNIKKRKKKTLKKNLALVDFTDPMNFWD